MDLDQVRFSKEPEGFIRVREVNDLRERQTLLTYRIRYYLVLARNYISIPDVIFSGFVTNTDARARLKCQGNEIPGESKTT